MRKRVTALTMAGVMAAALLTGCGGGNSETAAAAGGAADAGKAESAQTTAADTKLSLIHI